MRRSRTPLEDVIRFYLTAPVSEIDAIQPVLREVYIHRMEEAREEAQREAKVQRLMRAKPQAVRGAAKPRKAVGRQQVGEQGPAKVEG